MSNLIHEVQFEDEAEFRGIFRMDIASFESLLELILPKISKFWATWFTPPIRTGRMVKEKHCVQRSFPHGLYVQVVRAVLT